MNDLISRQAATEAIWKTEKHNVKSTASYNKRLKRLVKIINAVSELPSAEPDYTEMKQEFLQMASFVDVILECSDEHKEILLGFVSRLSEYMPWNERD